MRASNASWRTAVAERPFPPVGEGIVIPPFWSEHTRPRTLVAEASAAQGVAREILRNLSGEVI
jgi:hypothetical protein